MHDLIVIGAGPGGACAARTAAEAGLAVLLFEKKTFPRQKSCGGALSPRALSYLGEELPASLVESEVYGAKIKLKGETFEAWNDHRIALVTDRANFDRYLLERARAAGAEVRFEKIIDFCEKEDCVTVVSEGGREHRARHLVVAEGAQGRLKDRVKGGQNRERYALGVVATARPSGRETASFPDGMLQLEFGEIPQGYGWVFPLNRHYSTGLFGPLGHMKNARKRCRAFLEERGLSLDGPLKGHLVPYGWPQKKLATSRTLLCGDAGGFVDAFSGEGIAYAIRSGQLAAEVVAEALLGKGAVSLQAYEKACRETFDENLKYSCLFSRHMHRVPETFFRIFADNDELMNQYLDIPAGKRTYKEILLSLAARMPAVLARDMLKKDLEE